MLVDASADNCDEDLEYVCSCFSAITEDSEVAGFIFGGNLNICLNSTRHSFIINSLHAYNAVLAYEIYLDSHSFTFVSDCHNTTSWLDNVIVHCQLMSALNCFLIQYWLVSSDHRPIKFLFNACTSVCNVTEKNEAVLVGNWNVCIRIESNEIANCMNNYQQQVTLPSICYLHKRENKSNRESIDQYWNQILQHFSYSTLG